MIEAEEWAGRDSICEEIEGDVNFQIEMSGTFDRVKASIGNSKSKKIADGPQDKVFIKGSLSLDNAMAVADIDKVTITVTSETDSRRDTDVVFVGQIPHSTRSLIDPRLTNIWFSPFRHPRAGQMQGLQQIHLQSAPEPSERY